MGAIENDWLPVLKPEFSKQYYKDLYLAVRKAYHEERVYPPADDLLNAFHYTPLSEVKVVILGQDPYHEYGQAHGLCFSVRPGVKIPPSLINIYKELVTDQNCFIPNNGYLVPWAEQGVFLLNSVLTVREHVANSHRSFGWETFTDAVIKVLNEQDRPMVYLLWGRNAKEKCKILNNPKQLVLTAAHPSPLSAHNGFFGCRHFSKANAFLKENGLAPIDWQIPNL